MSYEKHTWVNNEAITASKMNNIEEGIEEASQSGGGGGFSTATITLVNDTSQIGEDYVIDELYGTLEIYDTNYAVNMGSCTLIVANNTVTVPMLGSSMSIIYLYGSGHHIGDDGGTGQIRVVTMTASGNVTIVDGHEGQTLVITGDGTLSIVWGWYD